MTPGGRCDARFRRSSALFGIIVIGIGLAHLAIGPDATIWRHRAVNATSDGEDRFYRGGCSSATGSRMLWCASGRPAASAGIDILAAAIFVGGIGRLLSLISSAPRIRSSWRCWYSICCRR